MGKGGGGSLFQTGVMPSMCRAVSVAKCNEGGEQQPDLRGGWMGAGSAGGRAWGVYETTADHGHTAAAD